MQDLTQDTELAGVRSEDDWLRARNNFGQQREQSLSDILRGEGRENENYGLNTQALGRRYGILASNQTQSANAAGVLGGGFAQQAAQKRAANQGLEQSDLDLTHRRALEDFGISRGRVNTATDEGLGELDLTYQRGNEDRSTDLTRAQRENRFFGSDVDASRWYAARQSGYVPPSKPKGEGFRVGAGGKKVYYQRTQGGAVLPGGRFLRSSQLRRYLRARGVR